MKRTSQGYKTTVIIKSIDEGKLNIDPEFQRGLVWALKNKQQLIDSILVGYDVNSLAFQKVDKEMIALDGKQRINAVHEFVKGVFALENGSHFADLTQEQQHTILDYNFYTIVYEDMTTAQRDEYFRRRNRGGMTLTNWEVTRVSAGEDVMKFVKSVTSHPIFKKFGLSQNALSRKGDEDLVLHILTVLYGECLDLSAKEIEGFTIYLKGYGIDPEIKEDLCRRLDYLNDLPLEEKQYKKFFKKIHVPMLVKAADGCKLDKKVFAFRLMEFFKNMPAEYAIACQGSGTSKYKNVIKRTVIMEHWFAPEPEEEESEETTVSQEDVSKSEDVPADEQQTA